MLRRTRCGPGSCRWDGGVPAGTATTRLTFQAGLQVGDFVPFTFPGALEGVGYGFEGAALLLAAQAFSGDRLRLWARWLLRATGLSAMVVLVDPVVRLPVALVLADGALAVILFTAVPILVAVVWWRSRVSLQSEVRTAATSGSPADLQVARPSPT